MLVHGQKLMMTITSVDIQNAMISNVVQDT
jgi:hypothetical protein